MKTYNKQTGRSFISWLVLSPLMLLGIVIALVIIAVLLCEANKAYWDHKVKGMCEKDGGIEVFEHIEVTQEEFEKLGGNQYGEIEIPFEQYRKPIDLYYIKFSDRVKRKFFTLTIGRSITEIIRVKDKKVMSKIISYGRSGGDFPTGIVHSSYFSCGEINNFNSRLIKSTVQIKGY